MWLDGYLKEREELLSSWATSKWHYSSPEAYLEIFKEWMFLTMVRRKFDFNVFLTNEELDNVVKVFNVRPDEFRFWECITNLISKIWFFEFIIELRNRSKGYVTTINALIEEGKFSMLADSLLSNIFNGIGNIEANLGFPVYASTGEVVFLRSFEDKEIFNGFLDRKNRWFLALAELLSREGYSLRYQWPFGTYIKSYPIDICLSL
jgi:hypothetical protein